MGKESPFNPNRQIYDTKYTDSHLLLEKEDMLPYDREMIKIRLELIRKYGTGKSVLDLCCGTGAYLRQEGGRFRQAVGVDFSSNMLNILKDKLGDRIPTNLFLVQSDAQEMGLRSELVDFVFSLTSLYYVPQVALAVAEISRVLKPGGYAVFELGNLWSLNTHVCQVAHRRQGVAKPFHIPYAAMLQAIQEADLTILEHRVFQILPLWGGRPLWLRPLTDWRWKWLMGLKIGGRMVDEWVSSRWPLCLLAFRHLFVCRKQTEAEA